MQKIDIFENHHPQDGVMFLVILHHPEGDPDSMVCVSEKFIKPFVRMVKR